MNVSVVIGTYNRAHLLEGTLHALALQEVPDFLKWEIVVVDNNSRDTTAQAVAAFSKTTAIPVRCVLEARQGLSHARNRGIREARGSVIAFTDDDVLPAADWVAQVLSAIDRWNAWGVGGRILPRWEASPPGWLTGNPRLLDRLSIMDFGEGCLLALPLAPQPQIWGANMAFRREIFEKAGEFDPRRGIVGKRLFRGEESALITRALELDLKIAYDPALTVYHRIGTDRVCKSYFRRLMFDDGEGRVRSNRVVGGWSILGAPLASYRAPFSGLVRWVVSLLLRRPGAFEQQLSIWRALGVLAGYWKAGLGRHAGEEAS